MPAKKVSRKKLLKEPDKVISTTGEVIQYLRDHQKQFQLWVIILLVVLAAAGGLYAYCSWQGGKALAIQNQAIEFYQEAANKGEKAETAESYKKALEKFKEADSVYNWGKTGRMTQVYIAFCHFAMNEYDQAISAYNLALEGPFRPIALNGLAYCYEKKGDATKALEEFSKNVEDRSSPFQEEGLLGAARCYETLGQKPKALEMYQKALDRNPKSKMADFIRKKIGDLKG
jgi:tetratricopeptide (TPR) repeat protein